ncbi:MAG TPA: DoxX family protein [Methylomirabilota bacterium]|nr:DoxX family protein [Methylomirabilota bacterium]
MYTAHAWGLTILRVVLGAIFIMHGYYALTVLGLARTADLIVRLGNPPAMGIPLAWYLIVAHLVGGLLLVIGLWTLVAALAQVPIMATAVFLLHAPQGFFMRATISPAGQPAVAGYEFSLLVLAATLTIVLAGPGAPSADLARGRRRLSVP